MSFQEMFVVPLHVPCAVSVGIPYGFHMHYPLWSIVGGFISHGAL